MEIFRAILITHMEHQNRIQARNSMPPYLLPETDKPESRLWRQVKRMLKALRWQLRQDITPPEISGNRDTSTQTQPQVSL